MTPGQVKRASGIVKGSGHFHVSELNGLPRWAGLNDLSKVNRAASKDFTAPVAHIIASCHTQTIALSLKKALHSLCLSFPGARREGETRHRKTILLFRALFPSQYEAIFLT